MKNLLTVLKKLGKKMTGEDITGKNLVTVVDDIADKYTGSSGGEGGGGGSDIFIIETTWNDDDGYCEPTNITYSEYLENWNTGAYIMNISGSLYVPTGIMLDAQFQDVEPYVFTFSNGVVVQSNDDPPTLNVKYATFSNDNQIWVSLRELN